MAVHKSAALAWVSAAFFYVQDVRAGKYYSMTGVSILLNELISV